MSALPPVRRRAIARIAAGFAVGLALWFGFRQAYERPLAAAAEAVLRTFERPPVTHLSARGGEILVDRSDFPPDSPRPGLPADDIDFNVVILTALFALQPRFFEGRTLLRLFAGLFLLFGVHAAALIWQVESVYAMHLGQWSAAHYGSFARSLWSVGFHFYLVAGRFAAPFVIWWLVALKPSGPAPAGSRKKQKR